MKKIYRFFPIAALAALLCGGSAQFLTGSAEAARSHATSKSKSVKVKKATRAPHSERKAHKKTKKAVAPALARSTVEPVIGPALRGRSEQAIEPIAISKHKKTSGEVLSVKKNVPSVKKDAPSVKKPAPEELVNKEDREPYILVINQDLRDVLSDYARKLGTKLSMSNDINQRLRNVRLPMERGKLTAFLKGKYDLYMFQDDDSLQVVSGASSVTKMFPLKSVGYDNFVKVVSNSGIDLTQYRVHRMDDVRAVTVTAPAVILGRIAVLIDQLRQRTEDVTIMRWGVIKPQSQAAQP